MNLARFPRRRYTEGWTPLHRVERLSKLLGGPEIYIKPNHLLGLASGENKMRNLEFLVADALAQGADTLGINVRRKKPQQPARPRVHGKSHGRPH